MEHFRPRKFVLFRQKIGEGDLTARRFDLFLGEREPRLSHVVVKPFRAFALAGYSLLVLSRLLVEEQTFVIPMGRERKSCKRRDGQGYLACPDKCESIWDKRETKSRHRRSRSSEGNRSDLEFGVGKHEAFHEASEAKAGSPSVQGRSDVGHVTEKSSAKTGESLTRKDMSSRGFRFGHGEGSQVDALRSAG